VQASQSHDDNRNRNKTLGSEPSKSCKENNPIPLKQNPKPTRLMPIALWLALVICSPAKIVNSQDNASPPDPIPKTNKDGSSLKFDFPAMLVGVAKYDEGPTGTTVYYFPKGVKTAVDVRGGAPGELNAAALQLSYETPKMQAVVFSGESWYGLSAATGVANGIKELINAKADMDFIAGVVGAIIYDVGGRSFSRVTPDDKLGKAVLLPAEPGWFPLCPENRRSGISIQHTQTAFQMLAWVTNFHEFDVSPDGQRFLIGTLIGEKKAAPPTVILNRTSELKK
jgi:hypothetical protein